MLSLESEAIHFETVRNQIDRNYEMLTPSQKKVALWLRENLHLAAMYPAREVGEETGVSEATIHRLIVALGYKNYAELKEVLQSELLNERTLIRFDQTQQKMKNLIGFQESVQIEFDNLMKTFTQETEQRIHQAADLIVKAKRIYIAGWRSSLAVTAPFSYQLNLILGNAVKLESVQLTEQLAYFTTEDVLFTVGFPRYDQIALRTVETAKEAGASIIVMTDSPLSPFCCWADVSLFASTKSTSFLDSYVAPLMIAQLMIQQVAIKASDRVKINLKRQEQLFQSWDLMVK